MNPLMQQAAPPDTEDRSLHVLLLSTREEDFFQIQEILRRAEAPVEAALDHARSLSEAKLLLGHAAYDLVLIDYDAAGQQAIDMLTSLFDAGFVVPFVFLTENADERMISEIIRAGAWDWLDRSHLDATSLSRALRATLIVHALKLEHRHAEEQVRQLSQALEQSADAVMITDQTGAIEYVNRAFEEINGYSRHDVIGKNPRILKSGETDPAIFRAMWKALIAGAPYRGTMTNRKRNGQTYPIEQTISPVRDEHGNITHFIASGRDLTEQRKLEGQLLQAQKLDAIGRLAGGIAHDFNNLLTIITSYAELALDEAARGSNLEMRVREVLSATQRAAGLTRQLLAFSRKQPQSLRVLDLNQVVAGIAGTIRRLVGEDIEFSFHPETQIGNVRMDPVQIEQILMNLAANARDAMPEGGKLRITTERANLNGSFSCGAENSTPSGDYVLLCAQDTGRGISSEDLEHIFEPFYTTKAAGQGTGLGLSTVYGIVKQCDGFVWACSEVGVGTEFKIYLPCVRGKHYDQTGQVRGADAPVRGSETVLLVEDERAIRNAAADFLTGCGYRILAASNGRDAIALAKRNSRVELVVTDVVMPEMSGGELAQQIKLINPRAHVLYVSGYPGKTVEDHKVTQLDSNFLEKPFSLKQLGRKVREVLDQPATMAASTGG